MLAICFYYVNERLLFDMGEDRNLLNKTQLCDINLSNELVLACRKHSQVNGENKHIIKKDAASVVATLRD